VFDIKKYAIHEGPGIRTAVFLKGCPLRCLWCCNPESQDRDLEVFFNQKNCIRCVRCFEVCPHSAIDQHGGIDRKRCEKCGKCVNVCYTGAKKIIGKIMTVEDVMKEVLKDRIFFGDLGGVTLSGGEPLFQKSFALEILKRSKNIGMNTTLDTCGYAHYSEIRTILEYVDLLLYDMKTIDARNHKLLTGVSNKLILENLIKIDKENVPIWIRIPIVANYTDSVENIESILAFVRKLDSVRRICLLPYHNLGISKYRMLDRTYRLQSVGPCTTERLVLLKRIAESAGFEVTIGG